MNRDNTRKNRHIFDYDYKVSDNFMLNKHTSHKYKTPYTGPFVITRCWKNGTVLLQIYATEIRYNIRHIKPYKSDTKVEYSINMYDDVSI